MSSLTGGQFNRIPFNVGETRIQPNPVPKEPAEMPRKTVAEDETGDSFTPTSKSPEKSAFPVASTAISGGVAGGAGFVLSALFLPKNQPTELKIKKGLKGYEVTDKNKESTMKVEIVNQKPEASSNKNHLSDKIVINHDDNTVEYKDYTYEMEKVNGKFKVKKITKEMMVGDMPYYYHETGKNKYATLEVECSNASSVQKSSSNQAGFNELFKVFDLQDGETVQFGLREDGHLQIDKCGDSPSKGLIFKMVEDVDKKMVLEETEDLRKMIQDNKITQEAVDAIKVHPFLDEMKIFDAQKQFKTFKSPEAIENLIHGAGRNWLGIAAITGIAIAAGAGIGYLLGNKNPQQSSQTKPQL